MCTVRIHVGKAFTGIIAELDRGRNTDRDGEVLLFANTNAAVKVSRDNLEIINLGEPKLGLKILILFRWELLSQLVLSLGQP